MRLARSATSVEQATAIADEAIKKAEDALGGVVPKETSFVIRRNVHGMYLAAKAAREEKERAIRSEFYDDTAGIGGW